MYFMARLVFHSGLRHGFPREMPRFNWKSPYASVDTLFGWKFDSRLQIHSRAWTSFEDNPCFRPDLATCARIESFFFFFFFFAVVVAAGVTVVVWDEVASALAVVANEEVVSAPADATLPTGTCAVVVTSASDRSGTMPPVTASAIAIARTAAPRAAVPRLKRPLRTFKPNLPKPGT
jgi:hypothetical protein